MVSGFEMKKDGKGVKNSPKKGCSKLFSLLSFWCIFRICILVLCI